jgi:hypothetical protein
MPPTYTTTGVSPRSQAQTEKRTNSNQSYKQTNKQTNKQPNNQTTKQPNNQPNKQTNNQATKQTTKQPSNQTTKQPNNQTTKQPNNQPNKQTNKQTKPNQTNKQSQATKQTAKQAPHTWRHFRRDARHPRGLLRGDGRQRLAEEDEGRRAEAGASQRDVVLGVGDAGTRHHVAQHNLARAWASGARKKTTISNNSQPNEIKRNKNRQKKHREQTHSNKQSHTDLARMRVDVDGEVLLEDDHRIGVRLREVDEEDQVARRKVLLRFLLELATLVDLVAAQVDAKLREGGDVMAFGSVVLDHGLRAGQLLLELVEVHIVRLDSFLDVADISERAGYLEAILQSSRIVTDSNW